MVAPPDSINRLGPTLRFARPVAVAGDLNVQVASHTVGLAC